MTTPTGSPASRPVHSAMLVGACAIGAAAGLWLAQRWDEPAPTTPPPPRIETTAASPVLQPAAAIAVAPPTVASAPEVPRAQPSLRVHNPCAQALRFAANYETDTGQRASAGFFDVPPGATLTPIVGGQPIALRNGSVHYYTETAETEPVELGRRLEVVGDRQVTMKRAHLDLPAMVTIELECPGATSGRS